MTHTHTHTHIYTYTLIYTQLYAYINSSYAMCACVFMCVNLLNGTLSVYTSF